MMRDVIEHIPNQEKFMKIVKQFLLPNGIFSPVFPPWQNPFGGHQQMCQSTILSKTPWFHLLPEKLYVTVLKWFGESENTIRGLKEIKDTGISIERFQHILKAEEYVIQKRTFYFINPNYNTKFGLKPRKQLKLLSNIP